MSSEKFPPCCFPIENTVRRADLTGNLAAYSLKNTFNNALQDRRQSLMDIAGSADELTPNSR